MKTISEQLKDVMNRMTTKAGECKGAVQSYQWNYAAAQLSPIIAAAEELENRCTNVEPTCGCGCICGAGELPCDVAP